MSVLALGALLAVAGQPGAAGVASAASPPSLPATVTVNPASEWVDTGIALATGSPVDISAMGFADCRHNLCPSNPDGVDPYTGANWGIGTGSPPFAAPALPKFSLIARVGATGAPVFVGSGPTTVGGSGELYLAFNDNNYGDNTGSFTATVEPLGAADLASCQAIHGAYASAPDGEYAVRVNGMEVPVYCGGMTSGSPGEYLALPSTTAGANTSFSPGDELSAKATTVYTKVAVEPASLVVPPALPLPAGSALAASVSDTTYASTTFNPPTATSFTWTGTTYTDVPYATAESCRTRGQGTANVDLSGTAFGVVSSNFQVEGSHTHGTTTISSDGQVANLTGGGTCGANGPGKIQGIGDNPNPAGFALGLTWLGPTVTASVYPTPNGNGWNNGPVTVSFTCTAGTLGAIASCPVPVTVSSQGAGQTVTGVAVDAAGNLAYATVNLNIDTTAPEATLQFAPPPAGAPNLTVTGTDAGGDPTTVTGPTCAPVPPRPAEHGQGNQGQGDQNQGSHGPGPAPGPFPGPFPFPGGLHGADHGPALHGPQLCTWTVTDQAGNSLTLVVRVQNDGRQVHASVVSLTYATGAGSQTVKPADNSLSFEWSVDHGTGQLQQLQEQLRVGRGPGSQQLQAHYDARQNVTLIDTGNHQKPTQQSGLVLLVMSTHADTLSIAI